ncbi:MAG: GntR family transcriptional regulator [Pseudomonadota bacterium]
MSDATDPYSSLIDAIDSGEFQPGARLIETDLAARLGVSRTPVRQALSRLEAHGLASRDERGGLVVATLDYDQLSELYAVREWAEGLAARLAARHAAPAEISVLEDLVAEDRATIANNPSDTDALARSNRVFHHQLHRASHNRYLLQTLETMRRSLLLIRGTTLGTPGRGASSVEEHAAIVTAIAARDEDGAETAARQHIANALRTRLRLEAGR